MSTLTKTFSPQSHMSLETHESSARIEDLLVKNKQIIRTIVKEIRQFKPHSVMTVGRGSSDHAGVFAKYLFEIEIGIPTFSAAPSIVTVYNKSLNLQGVLVIIISQSGRSPDILEQAQQAKASGALCIAILNDQQSPLVNIVDHVIPVLVGEEKSVAATKSLLATLTSLLQLVAYWKNDDQLINGLNSLPAALDQSANSPSQLTYNDLKQTSNLVVLGRGLGYAISLEIALKLKEVCAIHAEAFSSSEFLHGPVTLVHGHLKVLDAFIEDESALVHKNQIIEMQSRGADLVHLHQVVKTAHPRIAPLILLHRFYLDVEVIARALGLNPDNPRGLKKVTQTL